MLIQQRAPQGGRSWSRATPALGWNQKQEPACSFISRQKTRHQSNETLVLGLEISGKSQEHGLPRRLPGSLEEAPCIWGGPAPSPVTVTTTDV